jgi:5-oxopent-3-ene-1,2,5-tricarboxylate decarboxylase/2-hydroxyhepta-2,4-diene-1,7-dioate isomerase
VRGVDPRKQTLRTYRNGLVVQEAVIGEEMVWGPDYMVADIARHITLVPGDLILTGTPCHSRSLEPGDTIELEITELGRLTNHVVSAPAPRATGIGHPPSDTPEARRVALGVDERVPERFKANYRAAARSASGD